MSGTTPERPRRMLDLFCGRFGWGRAFAARGWEVVGVDLVEPPEIPEGCHFVRQDILEWTWPDVRRALGGQFDFFCASSPCEQFSVHGMKHFNPNPPYPELGIKLFKHTRALCESSGVPYVMENVRAAQPFVGRATNHCGPFYLWGNAVPLLMHQGIKKGWGTTYIDKNGRKRTQGPTGRVIVNSQRRHSKEITAKVATIPSELANCVCNYAERLLEGR